MQHFLGLTYSSVCICVLASASAVAGDLTKEALGSYELKGSYNQRVKISSPNGGRSFIGTFEVFTRGCQGDVRMAGQASGRYSILFVKKDPNVEGGACKINVVFSPNFNNIEVSHTYCGYSGASCDFNGKLQRTKR